LAGGKGADDVADQHPRAAHDGFAVANRRFKLDTI
jgi:hypothetical protein